MLILLLSTYIFLLNLLSWLLNHVVSPFSHRISIQLHFLLLEPSLFLHVWSLIGLVLLFFRAVSGIIFLFIVFFLPIAWVFDCHVHLEIIIEVTLLTREEFSLWLTCDHEPPCIVIRLVFRTLPNLWGRLILQSLDVFESILEMGYSGSSVAAPRKMRGSISVVSGGRLYKLIQNLHLFLVQLIQRRMSRNGKLLRFRIDLELEIRQSLIILDIFVFSVRQIVILIPLVTLDQIFIGIRV